MPLYRVTIAYRNYEFALVEAEDADCAIAVATDNIEDLFVVADRDPYGGDCEVIEADKVEYLEDCEHTADGEPYCAGCIEESLKEQLHPDAKDADVIARQDGYICCPEGGGECSDEPGHVTPSRGHCSNCCADDCTDCEEVGE